MGWVPWAFLPCEGFVQALSGFVLVVCVVYIGPFITALSRPYPLPACPCFPFLHRLVRVCLRVAMNATVMQSVFDIILGFSHDICSSAIRDNCFLMFSIGNIHCLHPPILEGVYAGIVLFYLY